ncbi:hypothetical protein [Pseudovibrio sp. Alg231-02]|uniref:hypothetical protein n=1 Tax=Pseudovibrio sp. Alg231-02 TaxID=1922223 RepID=UPI000D54EC3F|nr:hypothetical protein [Pseudovibrio sp. Alg231-02]
MVDGVSSSGVVQAAQPQQTTGVGIDVDAIRAGSSFGGKVVNVLRGLVHLGPTQASVQKHNDDVSAQFFQAASKRYGTTLATQVSASLLRQGQDATPVSKQELRSADATLHEVFDAIRNSDELKAYIPGGAEFTKLAQRYPLSSPAAQQTFERNLVSLAVEQGAKVENVEALANLAASTATGHVVRAYDGEHKLTGANEVLHNVCKIGREQIDMRKTGQLTPEAKEEFKERKMAEFQKFNAPHHNVEAIGKFGYFTQFNKLDKQGCEISSYQNYHGNKLHMSFDQSQLEKAYDVLTPLLLSEDNPFGGFKITNPKEAESRLEDKLESESQNGKLTDDREQEIRSGSDRALAGAQLTLYPFGFPEDGAEASQFKSFVTKLENALESAGINPGQRPESDVKFDNSQYTTFRHEDGPRVVTVGGDPELLAEIDALKDKPFYQALTR